MKQDIFLDTVLSILRRGALFIAVSVLCAGGLGAAYAWKLATPIYASSVILNYGTPQNTPVALGLPPLRGDSRTIATDASILISLPVLREVVRQEDLVGDPEFDLSARPAPLFSPRDALLSLLGRGGAPAAPLAAEEQLRQDEIRVAYRLRRHLRIEAKPYSDLLEITFSSADPVKARRLADAVVAAMATYETQERIQASRGATSFLSNRVALLDTQISSVQNRLIDLRDTAILLPAKEVDIVLAQLRATRRQIANLERRRDSALARQDALSEVDPEDLTATARALQDPMLIELAARVAAGDAEALAPFKAREARQRADMQAVLTESAEQIRELTEFLDIAARQSDRGMAAMAAALDAQRELGVLQRMQSLMSTQIHTQSSLRSLPRSASQVVGFAGEADLLTPRRPEIVVLSLILGALLSAGAVLWRGMGQLDRDTGAKRLAAQFGVPVLGSLPSDLPRDSESLLTRLRLEPDGKVIRMAQDVRTTLLATRQKGCILLTSGNPAHDLRPPALLLAQTLAATGHRPLVIDANLREAVEFWAVAPKNEAENNTLTLAQILTGSAKEDAAPLHLGPPNVDVLPAGGPSDDAATRLADPFFAQIIAKACEAYDLVLLTAPPAGHLTDATLLAPQVDGVLFLMHNEEANETATTEALRALRQTRAQLEGIIRLQPTHVS